MGTHVVNVLEGSVLFIATLKLVPIRGTRFECRTVLTNSQRTVCPDVKYFFYTFHSICRCRDRIRRLGHSRTEELNGILNTLLKLLFPSEKLASYEHDGALRWPKRSQNFAPKAARWSVESMKL